VRRWFLLCATPVAAERLGVVVSHIDITRRKEMEAAVEQRGLQMAALNELSRSLSATLDPREVSHRVLAAAQALIPGCVGRLWEVDADEVTLQVVGGIGLADPRGGQAFRSCDGQGLIGLAASSRQPVVSSVILQDPRFLPDAAWAQSERLVSGCVLPFILGERITGFLSLFTRTLHDFSAEELELLRQFAAQAADALQNARLHAAVQRQASELEARVRERTVALESALQVKGEFLARMSHEFRTPLNFITGFTDLLGQESADPLTQKQRGYVDRIRTGATRLLGLVEDLLDLSRVDAERTSLRLERFSVQPLILEVLGLFSVQATQKCVRLEFAVGPELSLVADRRRLFQIVANLVENAVKFTPQGGAVVVTAGPMSAGTERNDGAKAGKRGAATEEQQRREKTTAPGWVEIAVRDTGIGIAPPDLERIFLRFEQADGSPTRQYGGAGIGLALVRMLVDLHGGLIWAESGGQGMGARFAVALPPLSPAAIRRILVVENHPATLKTVCILLRDAGYAVEGVSTAQAAAAALAGQPPDLVLLDLGLPDTSGWDLLRQIRGTARTQNIQVLAMTEAGDEVDAAKALGADELVTKPISATALIQVVQDLLAGTERAAAR
jgi:signal transduction histidine kinase